MSDVGIFKIRNAAVWPDVVPVVKENDPDDQQKKAQKTKRSKSPKLLTDYIPHPPDGGYGWVVVLASFMINFIVDGVAFTFGIFIDDFQEYFEVNTGTAALIGSLNCGFYLLTAAMAGALVNKFGCRPVGIVGALVAAIGFALCVSSPDIGVMMFTYGVIGGIGLGHLGLPSVVAVSFYFQKRRALATGIAFCGTGAGCFVMAPLGDYLLDKYTWKGAMLIVAGISLNGCVFSALLRPLEPPAAAKKRRMKNSVNAVHKNHENKTHVQHCSDKLTHAETAKHSENNSVKCNDQTLKLNMRHRNKKCNRWKVPNDINKDDLARPLYRSDIFYDGCLRRSVEYQTLGSMKEYMVGVTSVPRVTESRDQRKLCRFIPRNALDIFVKMTDISLFTEPAFVVIFIANMVSAFALFIPFVFMTKRATNLHIGDFEASFLISIVGIANTCARIVVGVVSDSPCVNTLLLHNASLVLGGLICIANILCNDYASMCVYAAIYGLCIATWMTLTPIVLCNLLGLHRLTSAFGLLMTGQGISTFCATPVAGVIYDRTHDNNSPFMFCGALMLCGGMLCCLLVLPRFNKQQQLPEKPPRTARSSRIASIDARRDSTIDKTVKSVQRTEK